MSAVLPRQARIAPLDVQMASIRATRVAFVTHRQAARIPTDRGCCVMHRRLGARCARPAPLAVASCTDAGDRKTRTLECGGRTATLGGVLQSPELLSTDLTEGLQRIITLPLIIDQGKREFFSKLLRRDVLFEILHEDAMQRLICGSNNRIGRR